MERTACVRSAICCGSVRNASGKFRTGRWKNSGPPQSASAGKQASCWDHDDELQGGGVVRPRNVNTTPPPHHLAPSPSLIVTPACLDRPKSLNPALANGHAVTV